MREKSLYCLGLHGFHRVAYREWGDPGNPRVLVCVHGLTRNGRDFDRLALALASEYRVACPDVVGRGRSDWLSVAGDYAYPTYLADMAALMARLDCKEVDWVGTSMGGLIGMMLAAQPASPMRRLVLNDVGPLIPKAGLVRIAGYVGKDPRFANIAALERYLREVYAGFGALADDEWRELAENSARLLEDGSYGLAYDPAIAATFATDPAEDMDLWSIWDRVRCPVLVLRGTESDLLTSDIARAMCTRGPGARLVEFAAVGHAPMLRDPEQIAVVRNWLLSNP
jgi:Predicted hydrolases or acyltransferases (alpha/beta hydrolase superfamily)